MHTMPSMPDDECVQYQYTMFLYIQALHHIFTSESVCRYKLQLHFHTYNILVKENELWMELRFGKHCAKFTPTEWRENQNFLSWAQAFPIQDFKQHILQFPSRINSLFQDTLAEQKNGHAFQVLM